VAVREVLVNAVYHRGYEGPPEPIKVYLYMEALELLERVELDTDALFGYAPLEEQLSAARTQRAEIRRKLGLAPGRTRRGG
jgi:hypothetical protein